MSPSSLVFSRTRGQMMNEKIFSLPVTTQISPYISLRQLDELGIVVISHPKVRAAVALQGAQLLAWQPRWR